MEMKGEDVGSGETLACGWNREMIVKCMGSEAGGGACQGREKSKKQELKREEQVG